MDKKNLFKSLVLMAKIDGKITDREMHQLALSAARLGIQREDLEAALHEGFSNEVKIAVPSLPNERMEMLREMAQVMVADGELAPAERALLGALGKAMSISDNEVNAVIRAAL